MDAVAGREKVQGEIKKLVAKKKNTQDDLDNVAAGKKSMRTIFKNQTDTGTMATTIEHVTIFYHNLNGVYIYI